MPALAGGGRLAILLRYVADNAWTHESYYYMI